MKEENDKQEEQELNKIIYIGEDKTYWENLKPQITKTVKTLTFSFKNFNESDSGKIQQLLLKILDEKAKVVIIDISNSQEEMLHLIRLLVRLNALVKPFIMGVLDITTDDKYKDATLMAGCPVIHYKGSEVESTVYDITCFAFNSEIEDHGYATAQLNDMVNVFMPCKVGVISPMGIKVESNFSTVKGETYILKNFWSNKGLLKSSKVIAANQSSENLYYNFNRSQEFGFEFVTPPEVPEKATQDEFEAIKKEYEADLATSKSSMNEWVEKTVSESKEKHLKCLVVDKDYTFYKNEKRSDSYDFLLRCQPFLKYVKKELLHTFPHMIVFNMESISDDDMEASEDIAYSFNDNRTLQYYIKVIKSIEGFNPYIIVFNCPDFSTKKLQALLNYKAIVAYSEQVNTDIVNKMAMILHKRLKDTFPRYNVPVITVNKEKEYSYAEFALPITLLSCSEFDVYFDSDLELTEKTTLRLEEPIQVYISVAPHPPNSKFPNSYYGLVHGATEKETMGLRQYVNSVFFRQLEEKKAEDKQEVEKAKEAYIQKKEEERLEAERIAQEEKEAEERKEREEAQRKEEEESKRKAEQAEIDKQKEEEDKES